MLRFGLLVSLIVVVIGLALQENIPLLLERYGFAMLLFFIGWKMLEEKE